MSGSAADNRDGGMDPSTRLKQEYHDALRQSRELVAAQKHHKHGHVRCITPNPEWYKRLKPQVVTGKPLKVAGRPNKVTAIGAHVKQAAPGNEVAAHYKDFKVLRDYRCVLAQ